MHRQLGTADDIAARIDDVMAALVHEVRAPIIAVRFLLSRVRSATDQRSREEGLDAILRNLDCLSDIVRSLHDVRSLETGSLALNPEEADLGKLVWQAADDLAPVVEPHDLLVDAREQSMAVVDPGRVRQIVVNLVSNAAKFSPVDSAIEIALHRADGGWEISVTDHGPGVPPDQVEEIFEKYARLSPWTQGLGLGLYLSRNIARAHAGDLFYEPAENGGSRFTLRLPVGVTARPLPIAG